MRVSTLRAVDRWLGVPACLLLTLCRRAFRRAGPGSTVRRILFVKLAEQGSTVLAAAALDRAVRQVGRENVFFLAFEENRFVLDAMDLVPGENVLTLDAGSLARAARSVLRVVARLRALRIDAAIDLEFFARSSAILAFLSGAPVRVGLHSFAGEGPWRGDLMTHRLVCNPYLHTGDLFLVMVEALAHPAGRFPACAMSRPEAREARPPRELSPADVEAMRRLVGECTGADDGAPIILLNPNAGDLLPLRRWDRARYVDLARRLLAARPEVHVLLTGGPGEAREAEALAADVASPRCVSVAGRTTFAQLLALYARSRVLVTNDSGPAHFAALTPIDIVTLFGPETPALFAARTPRNHVVWAGTVCSPCVNAFNNRVSRCRDNICMQQITVDQVFQATMAAYQDSAARHGAAAGVAGSTGE
jgi:ADP-heptose:LPS heptosyltransferase